MGRAVVAAVGRAVVAAVVVAAGTVLAPAAARPSPIPAPPNAPIPAIKPFLTLPVANPVAPPTSKAADKPPVIGANNAPAIIGKIALKNPASGSPVCGLMVNEPPCAIAICCRPATSFGVM